MTIKYKTQRFTGLQSSKDSVARSRYCKVPDINTMVELVEYVTTYPQALDHAIRGIRLSTLMIKRYFAKTSAFVGKSGERYPEAPQHPFNDPNL